MVQRSPRSIPQNPTWRSLQWFRDLTGASHKIQPGDHCNGSEISQENHPNPTWRSLQWFRDLTGASHKIRPGDHCNGSEISQVHPQNLTWRSLQWFRDLTGEPPKIQPGDHCNGSEISQENHPKSNLEITAMVQRSHRSIPQNPTWRSLQWFRDLTGAPPTIQPEDHCNRSEISQENLQQSNLKITAMVQRPHRNIPKILPEIIAMVQRPHRNIPKILPGDHCNGSEISQENLQQSNLEILQILHLQQSGLEIIV
ncbi:hypothetical protein DUI87_04753 [Hirundo rustica rustica]|uniref:Uncharacterized protein n=1 Tax=Hirundo rustica rustica TaxID=333673 RepID=A0A3M0LIH2_HIRRU|nr:hypothetical protein DUI87_04753 [Hirundo rustica rustica]